MHEKLHTAIHSIYDRDCVGCCLHLVLDDGCVRDETLDWLRPYVAKHQHEDCAFVLNTLAAMTLQERVDAIPWVTL